VKVRNGLVSNSSTSSFCIYGTVIKSEEYEKIDWKNFPAGFREYSMPDWDGREYAIGRNWTSVRDDETGAQFKQNVRDTLNKLLDREIDCCTVEEAWYNG